LKPRWRLSALPGVASDISAILPPRDRTTKDFTHEINSKAPEGAATAASTGAAVGGVLGWLVGIGALAIPGIDPRVAAAPISSPHWRARGGAAGGLVRGLVAASDASPTIARSGRLRDVRREERFLSEAHHRERWAVTGTPGLWSAGVAGGGRRQNGAAVRDLKIYCFLAVIDDLVPRCLSS
jgi:hypothetical protein